MSIDLKQSVTYQKQIRQITDVLIENQELFDEEKMAEFLKITRDFQNDVELAQQQSRKLSIGIVGAVKAGKSSFLNACIFDGVDYLPKAATAMTAALTKISYSEHPNATIHYYSREDWDDILKESQRYDTLLNQNYEKYRKKQKENTQSLMYDSGTEYSPTMSKQEYERTVFRASVSERLQGAKELTTMAQGKMLEEKLGGQDQIDGDVVTKLQDYVGVNGQYTPIVSYVELQVNNEAMKDLEIIDTPGLNDSVVSRGLVTKKFLHDCDVVVLLSPCGQFMNVSTINLMASSLPSAGVREIMVIGSKLDDGILNESCNSFLKAWKSSLYAYDEEFHQNLQEIQKSGIDPDVYMKLSKSKPLYISSICYSIGRKLGKQPLNEEENHIQNQFIKRFPDFDNKYLKPICGIKEVRLALNAVRDRKDSIIESRNNELIQNARLNHMRVLEKILQELQSSTVKLNSASKDELQEKIKGIQSAIGASRRSITAVFDAAKNTCDRKIQKMLPWLQTEQFQHQDIKVDSHSYEDHTTKHSGLFGLRKEIVRYTVTDHEANVSEVVKNIRQYTAKCQDFVVTEFDTILDIPGIARKIKEIVLCAFAKNFTIESEDEILIPVQNVLDKLTIPHISIDCSPYIDKIQTMFKDGYAKNEKIHTLKTEQSAILSSISEDMTEKMDGIFKELSTELAVNAVTFSDEIEKKFCKELEKLARQIDERDKYQRKYEMFTEQLRTVKKELRDFPV